MIIIFAFLVLASATAKFSVYWILSKSIYIHCFGLPYWFHHFLFLNVEFADSSSTISKTFKKLLSYSFKFSIYSHFGHHIGSAISYFFIQFQFRFAVSIFQNRQLPNIKYIRSKERCTRCIIGILKHQKSISAQ